MLQELKICCSCTHEIIAYKQKFGMTFTYGKRTAVCTLSGFTLLSFGVRLPSYSYSPLVCVCVCVHVLEHGRVCRQINLVTVKEM